MSATDVAVAHYRRRRALSRTLTAEGRRLWRQIDRRDLSRSWRLLSPRLLVALAATQLAVARDADTYVARVLAAQGIDPDAVGEVVAAAFAGTASDGRPLDSLLDVPVIATKQAISRGASEARAVAAGAATLDMILRTETADAGRVADGVALAARRRAGGYVRMVVGATCARCTILAGRWYRWNQGFQRHPRCDCVHIPSSEDRAGDLRTDPKAAFRALSAEEQDRIYTKAGAQAIRDGADMSQVVNARKGMYTAGGRQLTRTGATSRGFAGARLGATRGTRATRLMPEQIYREAAGNRDEALRLLRMHGYIL